MTENATYKKKNERIFKNNKDQGNKFSFLFWFRSFRSINDIGYQFYTK